MYSRYIITIIFIILFLFLYLGKTTTGFGAGPEIHGFEKIQANFMFALIVTAFISTPIIILETVVTTAYDIAT